MFDWPNRNKAAVDESVRQHVKHRDDVADKTVAPTREEYSEILEMTLKAFGRGWSLFNPDEISVIRIREIIEHQVDKNSSPGYPYCLKTKTNKDFFGFDALGRVPDDRLAMVCGLVADRIDELATRPASDPIRVFIKEEPASINKRSTGALRLISSVSVVDTIVHRLFFGGVFDKLVKHWGATPNMAGWSLGGGKWRFFKKHFKGKAFMADKKKWDWSMQPWLANLTRDVLLNLGRFEGRERVIADNALRALYGMKFEGKNYPTTLVSACTRCGACSFYEQRTSGLQKSGWLGTIITNGMQQYALAALAKRRLGRSMGPIFTMGDDTIEEDVDDVEAPIYVSELEKGGCIVGEYKSTEDYDFAGFTFPNGGGRPVPNYGDKHAFTLAYANDKEGVFADEQSRVASYITMYYNDKASYRKLLQYAAVLEVDQVPSDFELMRWYG
ncbi:hypothetical protein 2 [Shahe sobemo-like virus 1]|uniref:hypothetical protein 2 n=1 Tax=Shahe sobemo-like virus 1 TaxID=1923454 RepID=UPI00090BB943|nr:hypothetical protein 2 [Shahe sobemo-like virus 1]APG75822.1 hypothetical protein 2 [Shahe sobemo-like virus 1]